MEFPDSFWNFIHNNRSADPSALRLKYYGNTMADFDVAFAIVQIECRKKFAKKLADTLHNNPKFIFPSALAGEQSTSDALAAYHSELIEEGATVADLTAGLGIDVSHMLSKGCHVTAIEWDKDKAEILRYNFPSANLSVVHADCREWIATQAQEGKKYNVVFIDPARRAADGNRVFALNECEPDVVAMLPTLRHIANKLIIKASPMLDISHTASLLPGIERVIALGTTTECKELIGVVDLQNETTRNYDIEACTLSADKMWRMRFTPQQEAEAAADCKYGLPVADGYLYEPFPATMKAAPFNLLSSAYGIDKLHPNTHLYCSNALCQNAENFPGDIFRIERVIPFESKHLKRFSSQYKQISIAARNFEMSTDTLRKKLDVKDGGTHRLFAATAASNQKLLIVAHK